MGIKRSITFSALLTIMYAIVAVCLFAIAQASENNVHVSGYKAPTQVFAMPYGAYGAGSYGGYGAGYGAGYGTGYGAGYGGYGAYGNLYGSAYAPVSSYNSAYAPVSSYSAAYAPVDSYRTAYAPVTADYKPAGAYAPVESYSASYAPVAADYRPAATYAVNDYSTGYGSYGAGYGLNYGSYAPKDGKLVSVIDRSHGYGNVKYSVPTPFLSNSAYGPAKH